MISLLIFIAIGAIAGILAGKIMKQEQDSLVKNIILGVIGAFVGGFLLSLLGISAGGLIGSIVTATLGAVVVIYVADLIAKKK